MTNPELIRLEDLVNRLLDGLDAPEADSGAHLVNSAREYAEACDEANRRLQLCLDIMGKGKDKGHQALMAATRAPDLLDTCALLSELQTDEYLHFCRENHLPQHPSLNERAKQAIDPLYARAGSFQKKLRMEFSAANSKRDFRAALEIARQLAKVDPADAASAKQASTLEERLIRDILEKEIIPALDKGDDDTAVAALAKLEEIAPERQPRSDDRFGSEWKEAIELRKELEKDQAIRESANYLIQAEAARDADNLESVLEILGRITASREKHDFELSPDKEALFQELQSWKETAIKKAKEESNFQAALEELKRKLKQISDKKFQSTPPLFEETREDALELQRLWKEIAEYRKPVEDSLQERARKILGELNDKIDRHKRAKRRNLIAAISAATVLLVFASVFTTLFLRSSQAAERLREAKIDGRSEDLTSYLEDLDEDQPLWVNLGALPRERENAQAWLQEQEALSGRISGVFQSIREEFESRPETSDWSPVSLMAIRDRIDQSESELEGLNRDARIPLEATVTSLSLEWDQRLSIQREELVEKFATKVKELDEKVQEQLQFGKPIADLAKSTTKIGQLFSEMQGLASGEFEELRPSAADLARFEVLEERFRGFEKQLETVQEIMTKCRGSESLQAYSQAVRVLNDTDFLQGPEKIALGNLVVATDSEDRVFRDILMPGEIVAWQNLSERSFGADGYPDDISSDEEVVFLTMRDDESLGEIYLYDIRVGGQTRTIFCRGKTLKGDQVDGAGRTISFIGDEVYDPSGGSLSSVIFKEKKYLTGVALNERLSPESRFFQSLNFGNMVDEDFQGFTRAGLDVVDAVLTAPDEVSPVFQAYLFEELGRLMGSRREKWLLDFSNFGEDLGELKAITKGTLEPEDWCAPAKRDELEQPLRKFFSARQDREYLKRAKAVYSFYARVFTGGLVFGGFVNHEDEKVLLGGAEAQSLLWGFDDAGSVVKAFQKSPDGNWEVTTPVTKFSPLFFLGSEPAQTWHEAAEANFVDPDDPVLLSRLPEHFNYSMGGDE
ncbi:hypothetical protein N9E25_00300 [Verrucomicrobiales bacterium]|nr:hypothetical protein [Verrucomicrobiales bacterium]MDC3352976.1 hypothetical protein [Verrucomicrobiales bacterium]